MFTICINNLKEVTCRTLRKMLMIQNLVGSKHIKEGSNIILNDFDRLGVWAHSIHFWAGKSKVTK